MRKLLEILTPENVNVEFELAGLGSRFIAILFDTIIQGVIMLIVIAATGLSTLDFIEFTGEQQNSLLIAIGILVIYLIYISYFMIFESLMNGMTPGKWVAKIRVIKRNGEPISFLDIFLRNLIRFVDILPTYYIVGIIMLLVSKDYQRIGDYAANTVVVKSKKVEQLVSLKTLLEKAKKVPLTEPVVNKFPVSLEEYQVLKEFMDRRHTLGERREVFVYHLSRYFKEKFKIAKNTSMNPYDFFDEILRCNS